MKAVIRVAASLLRRVARSTIIAAALGACGSQVAHAQSTPACPDTFVTRLEALALIQTLNAEILSSRSATLSLEKWCRDHALAEEPTITARRVATVDKPLTTDQQQRLQVTNEPVK